LVELVKQAQRRTVASMSTLTLTVKKPARPLQRRAKRQRKATKYVFGLGWGKITPVHTGIKDLSEREGLDA
jgi:hypothetical protein